MKIAMIIEAWHPIWGGGQKVAYEISKRLSENYNIKVDLFVMNLAGKQENFVENINNKFRVIYVGKKRNWTFKDRIFWLFDLVNIIRKFHKKHKYNLIYAHSTLPGLPGKLLSKWLKIPVVFHVHGSSVEVLEKMYGKGLKTKILKFLNIFIQRMIKYDLEITVDRKFLEYKNVNKPVYIPNGVDVERFEKFFYLKEYKINRNFQILFVGRFDRIKGVHILLQSINLLKNFLRKKNVIIKLIGYGYEEKFFKNFAKRLKLEDIVFFKGKLFGEELIKEYMLSDLFVLPSLSEGFPLTILEAWAAKLPVLVSNVGEIPFIVKDGYNGFLVNPGDVNDLTEKLRLILDMDKDYLKKIGERGYNLVKKNYDWDKIVEKIYFYSNILKYKRNFHGKRT